jgi:hypothetical protein
MIRATLIILLVSIIGTAAMAISNASVSPKTYSIQMNDVNRAAGPIMVENCAKEDCSDTPSSS